MKRKSKFDYGVFHSDDYHLFAVSKQKYTLQEACLLFERETDEIAQFRRTQDGAVIWRAGVSNNEPLVCWWLHFDHDGTEPRYCPVWVFEY